LSYRDAFVTALTYFRARNSLVTPPSAAFTAGKHAPPVPETSCADHSLRIVDP